MEHLSLEIFDLPTKENPKPTGSNYAVLPENATITITDTSEIFSSGDVWSHSFTLNAYANAHILGTAGEIHGSRLHEQINKRRARLWVDGLPLYFGYLMLDDEAEVDANGDVDVKFESGQKTFDEMIGGTSAREVSVGDVVIGVALNRKRVVDFDNSAAFTLDGLKAYANNNEWMKGVDSCIFTNFIPGSIDDDTITPYTQRWPKLVKSYGEVLDSSGNSISPTLDFTNVQTPYDAGHPFCNINICYPFKSIDEEGEEVAGRGYTTRLAHGKPTVDGGDNQTRYNNAPNFYLLYFIDRLFKDMGIHITENQAKNVEDLRRVFMLNYGCHYEEIENDNDYYHSNDHDTPQSMRYRYGQYYLPLIDVKDNKNILEQRLVCDWTLAGKPIYVDEDVRGKVLMREVEVRKDGAPNVFSVGSVEGRLTKVANEMTFNLTATLRLNQLEYERGAYSAYLAYATGDNYPNVEISEIIDAMKSMFGVRLIFSNDYSTVRIVLLRNIFLSSEVQRIDCDIVAQDEKIENCIRGFRMTYGKDKDNTSFYYKGFADLLQRAAMTWKDTSDKHDYSQWEIYALYDEIKQYMSAFNRKCYITPVNGNAYGTQVDEDEDVLFPSLLEWAGYMDAEDGDCSQSESDGKTIEEIQCGATPVLMNEVGIVYASLFSGDLKAPTPDTPSDLDISKNTEHPSLGQKIATFGRATKTSVTRQDGWRAESKSTGEWFTVKGDLDIYISEGFQIRMKDNYAISNGGTPFDESDPGLCFGIMRSSGDDAYVRYYEDVDDREDNDAWDIEPGSGAVSHPDSCDNYGKLWDYTGSISITPLEAPAKLSELFPGSDAPFYNATLGYITDTYLISTKDNSGRQRNVLIACSYSIAGTTVDGYSDLRTWSYCTLEEILAISQSGRHMVVEVDSSMERGSTLVQLCALAYGGETEPMMIDDGVGSRYGRFSLKLRAEKLNPYYDPNEENPYSSRHDRYLPIGNPDLRGRGLCDQFYKEYSYWVRNARIVKRTVRMELSQLLTIDKTKRVTVGDVTGFIRKMEYSVSNDRGLGNVIMEIMYI